MRIRPIGHIESPYLTKFGVPRQANLCPDVPAAVVIDDAGESFGALGALTEGARVWVVWAFSLNDRLGRVPSATVRPPRLGGNERIGVFATRSSFRPNALAISCVTVKGMHIRSLGTGTGLRARIQIVGCDMVDMTPVVALIPYSPSTDYHPDAHGGWAQEAPWPLLAAVEFSEQAQSVLGPETRRALAQVLIQDPRPAYTRTGQQDRVFQMAYERYGFSFKVDDRSLVVLRAWELTEAQLDAISLSGSIEAIEKGR